MAREKYDPFGNPIGEDAHGGLEPPSGVAAAPAPGPVSPPSIPLASAVTATPPTPPHPPVRVVPPPPVLGIPTLPQAQPRRRRSALGVVSLFLRVAIPLALVAGLIIAINAGVNSTVRHATPTLVRPLINDATDAVKAATPAAAPRPPHGLSHSSLLRPALLRSALQRGAAAGRGRLKQLRLAPDRLDLQFGRADGGLDLVQVRWDSAAPSVVRSPSGNSSATAPLTGSIDVHAPERLVRAAAARLHRRAGKIDYLVLLKVADRTRWAAYFQGGKGAFMADAHGRITQRMY